MSISDRKTINFDHDEAEDLAPFLDEATPQHRALEELYGSQLASDSAELRALVMLGIRRVRAALLEDAYNSAVDAGQFDDSDQWLRRTSRARHAHLSDT